MGPNGRDDRRRERRPGLSASSEAQGTAVRVTPEETDLVFDFSGMHGLSLTDLALTLTARLHAEPGGRVWVRQIPYDTWKILQALGLDHLFHVYPGLGGELN